MNFPNSKKSFTIVVFCDIIIKVGITNIKNHSISHKNETLIQRKALDEFL